MVIAVWTADKWGPLPVTWWAVIVLVSIAGLFGLGNGALNKLYRPVDGLVQGVVGRMGSGKSLLIVSRVLIPFCNQVAKRGRIMSPTGRPMRRAVTNFRFDPGNSCEVRNVMPSSTRSIFAAVLDLADEIGDVEGPWLDDKAILHDGEEPLPDIEPFELSDGRYAYVRQPILNGLVVLDEMHLFANSNAVALGEEASYFISMARKLNCEVWWASQHEMKVHKRLRDESSSIWLAGKVNGLAGAFVGSGWHIAREYHSPALVERARNSLGTNAAPRASDKRVYRFTKATKRFYNSFELLVPDPSMSAQRRGARSEAGRPPVRPRTDHDTLKAAASTLDTHERQHLLSVPVGSWRGSGAADGLTTAPSATRGATSAHNARSRITNDFPSIGDPAPTCDDQRTA